MAILFSLSSVAFAHSRGVLEIDWLAVDRLVANCDLLVLSCRNQNSPGARGFSIFDFAPGSPVVASRCWRGVCNLIEIEKLALGRHYSFLLFGRFSIVLGISRPGYAAERTKFDVYWSHFDRWCAKS